jgi:hypothetical protein
MAARDDESKPELTKVGLTNTSRRSRIFRDGKGEIVRLHPGKTVDAHLTEDDITRFKEELGDYDEARDEFRPHVVVGETTDEQAAKAPSGGQPARRRRKR